MLILLISLVALTGVAPAVVRRRPRLAPLLALIPLLSGVWLGWLASRQEAGHSFAWAPALGVRLSFMLDGLAMLFASLICGIGVVVFLYSSTYLKGDPRLGRFFGYLLFFFLSMLGLVLADNIIALFVFWELTSLSSFLLIGYQHERAAAREAALQTLLVTGLGGLALLAGLLMLGSEGGSFELSELLASGTGLKEHAFYVPALLLIALGAFSKSAQFPFHFWLPAAMEAPTPVSAYLHSATMVKAGVYLLARFSPLFGGTTLWTVLVTGTGLVTMLLGFLAAFPQRDSKRMLAYSTIGMLGMLTMLVGIGSAVAIQAAMAALLAHALYKAALFLIAGALERATGTRDVYQWRGLWPSMHGAAVVSLLAAGSLAGLPPLFGYVAKKGVLTAVWDLPAFAVPVIAAVSIAGLLSVAIACILALHPFTGTAPTGVRTPSPVLWGTPAVLAALGVLFGAAPFHADRWLVLPAVNVVLGGEPAGFLALWHGFDLALLISSAMLLGGVLIYRGRHALLEAAEPMRRLARYGPARAYILVLSGVLEFARRETRVLQSGKLRNYMLIVLLTATGLGFHALAAGGGLSVAADWRDLRLHEALLAALMAAAAIAALLAESRLVAVASLGVVGLAVALVFLLFGAPDLAITQFLVETLTVILLVLVLYHLPRFARLSSARARVRDLSVALAAGALLTVSLLGVNGAGRDAALASYYSETSVSQAHGRNVVNVILVDFRALDTLGEITVLAVAAVGVFGLLKLRLNKGGAG